MSPSRTAVLLSLALSLASCASPGPWAEDLLPRLAGPRVHDLADECWGVPAVVDDDDLPAHIWAYDGEARIWHDRERDVYVAWDSTHERWIPLTPERASLEFRPERARIVATEGDEPWKRP